MSIRTGKRRAYSARVSAFVAGLIGTGLGLLLKWVADLATERLRHAREDRVWRREKYVEVAVEVLAIAWELKGANAAVVREVYSLGNAERGGNPETIRIYRERLQSAYDRHGPLPAVANRAFEMLRLYAPPNVTAEARKLLDLAHHTAPEVTDLTGHSQAVDDQATIFADIVRFHTFTS